MLLKLSGRSFEEQLAGLIRENVVAQLENIATHPAVAGALERQELRLHGWVYEIGRGIVSAYDAHSGDFLPLSEHSLADAAPVP